MTSTRLISSVCLAALVTGLSGCASLKGAIAQFGSGTTTTPDEMSRIVYVEKQGEAVEEAELITADMPSLIMPGQMKANPVSIEFYDSPSLTGFQAVSYANRSAIVEPVSDNYLNAIQLYPYTPGSLYQVYTSPSQVTDIALEKGEALTSVSAGDTERWTVGDTVSGSGPNEQVHILVKPMAPKLSTNAVITTTKRTYYLDLKSFADTYMAAVSWRYPHDAIRQLRKNNAVNDDVTLVNAPINAPEFDQDELRFDYAIKGDTPNWRPMRVFDDGQKIYIEFPKGLAVSEAPPLFVTDGKGDAGKLVNYRVKGDFYIVDRLFDFAELRLGEKKQTVVRIERAS